MLFLLVWLDPFMLRLHGICGPVFHCYSCPLATFACPIGVLANFSALHVFPFLAVGILLVIGGLVGSFLCGWVCPFGFLQDLIGKIPIRRYKLPVWCGYLRYAVLFGLVLAIPFFFGEGHSLFICRVCPAGALEGSVPNMVKSAWAGQPVTWPGPVKIGVVLAFLIALFLTHRPWCAVCPLGAIFGLCNRFSLVFLKFHPTECSRCDTCRARCHYEGAPDSLSDNDLRCVRCLECTRCGSVTVATVFDKPETPDHQDTD